VPPPLPLLLLLLLLLVLAELMLLPLAYRRRKCRSVSFIAILTDPLRCIHALVCHSCCSAGLLPW
jgi:hypothetical protein